MNNSFILFTLVSLMVLGSGSLIVKTLGDDYFFILLFFASIVIMTFKKNSSLKSVSINYRYLILLFFIIVFHMFFHKSGFTSYVGLGIRIFTIVIVAIVIEPKLFWNMYVDVIALLSALSLLGFVLINYFEYLVPGFAYSYKLHDVNYQSSIDYNNLIFITWRPINYFWIIRNQSIFWEPGAFQFFVNLAFIWNNYFNNNRKKQFNILFAVTIISTFSTLGYMMFALIVFSIWSAGKRKNIVAMVSGVVVATIIIMSPIVTGKFSSESLQYASYQQRLYDTIIDLALIKDHFLFGYGFGNLALDKWAHFNSNMVYNVGFTSSNNLLMLVGQFGIILFTVYIFPLLNSKYPLAKVVFLVFIFGVLSGENFATSYIILSVFYISESNLVIGRKINKVEAF